MGTRRLKVVLWIAGLGCGIAILGVVLPWSWLSSWAAAYGLEEVSPTPLRVYATRAASATWAFVGLFFLLVARDPLAYAPFLNLVTGVAVNMQPPWYLTDVAFCWVIGLLLVAWRQPKPVTADEPPV
jgi:hypothetical protein